MGVDTKKLFPRWMQEFKRFQSMKSEIFLYGNIYDCSYFPINYKDATEYIIVETKRRANISGDPIWGKPSFRLEPKGVDLIVIGDLADRLNECCVWLMGHFCWSTHRKGQCLKHISC